MKTLLLGVTGGIAAYKAVELASALRKQQWDVHAILTRNATEFITPLTFEAITRNKVHTHAFAAGETILHIDLARKADVVAIVPASADFLARAAGGMADDLLTTTVLATTAPVIVAPAMNVEMWRHSATQDNLARLRTRGVIVIEPQSGELACGEFGEGRLADLETISERIRLAAVRSDQLQGRRILVTAGGTREPLDPVRFIGNRSSGKMGYCLAAEAASRGATVTLVSAAKLPHPPGVNVVGVETAAEMAKGVLDRLDHVDVLVMAAAVADWRPAQVAEHKLKKAAGSPVICLEPTLDILAEAGARRRSGQLLVGFAAETDDLLANARDKVKAKRLDLLVANDAVTAMESEDNAVIVLDSGGMVARFDRQPKRTLAAALWDLFSSKLAPST
ncbi:MAG: bifunctional phosphopantothenoylcysteine decarboxylase/phosphopantothenate--cysteine ligase CoaBC [Cyanobacteria bacterium REEB65]|nr:bifunctional phosphopantothenoylcysteine decarboxylase/phosphopantothenate--cysteine ligase CoaBC [Cyanobacteria bacterium REEB65]